MNRTDRRTIDLPEDQSAFIDRLIARGDYRSADDVVEAGIRVLQKEDAAFEHFLRTEVLETHERMRADPDRGIPLDQVETEFRKRFLKRRDDAA